MRMCPEGVSCWRARAENRATARGTGSGLPPARGSCNQRPVHVPRTPPVAVTAGADKKHDDEELTPIPDFGGSPEWIEGTFFF